MNGAPGCVFEMPYKLDAALVKLLASATSACASACLAVQTLLIDEGVHACNWALSAAAAELSPDVTCWFAVNAASRSTKPPAGFTPTLAVLSVRPFSCVVTTVRVWTIGTVTPSVTRLVSPHSSDIGTEAAPYSAEVVWVPTLGPPDPVAYNFSPPPRPP